MINLNEDVIKELVQKEIGEQIAKHLKSKEVRNIIKDTIISQLGEWRNIGAMSEAVKDIMKEDKGFYNDFKQGVTNKIVDVMICNLQNDDY